MLKYNILLFIRNIKKHKSSFAINIIGLSTGLACVLLITLWVLDEMSVDKFHENDSNLFQIVQRRDMGNDKFISDFTPPQTESLVLEKLPEVKLAASIIKTSWFDQGKSILFNGKNYITGNYYLASNDFFKVFSYKLLHGNVDEILVNKNEVAISDEMAHKLFGSSENIVGKSIEWVHDTFGGTYVIKGIFQEPPSNSTAQFNVLFHKDIYAHFFPHALDWHNNNALTYIVLRNDTGIQQFNKKLTTLLNTKHELLNDLFVQSYSSQYLYGNSDGTKNVTARIQYIKLFSILAIFILVIACINYINLSTAKSTSRTREIGIKKALGAKRKSLIGQYLTESILLSFISLFLSIGLVFLLLPQFEIITGKNFQLDFKIFNISILITIVTGLLSGLYPAIYLSGFNPIKALKGIIAYNYGEQYIRRALVVFQFSAAIILIITFTIIFRQIELINSKNLGYSKEHIISFEMGKNIPKTSISERSAIDSIKRLQQEADIENFLNTLRKVPGVNTATNFRHNMIGNFGESTGLSWEGKNPENKVVFGNLIAGYDYIETLGISMKEGRSYSREFSSESTKIVLNDKAIKVMGLKDPIGKVITVFGEQREIIGVTEDFHFASLYEELSPLFFNLDMSSFSSNIMVKLVPGDQKATIDRIAKIYATYFNGQQLDYKFLDSDYQKLYSSENRIASLSKYFTIMAIVISSLGLFGLASFTVERRKKEISIRKVLGQSASQITVMLSNEFTRLVLISILIASPIAYFLAYNWLSDFAYRIPINVWYFISAGILVLVVAILTVSFQAIKAARANPIKSLRTE